MANTSDKIRLSGLWAQVSEAGQEYLAGAVTPTMRLLILRNTRKERSADPDYIAYLAPGKEEQKPEAVAEKPDDRPEPRPRTDSQDGAEYRQWKPRGSRKTW